MPNSSVQCGSCFAVLDETTDQANRPPCPHCGSNLRQVNISVSDDPGIQPKEMVGTKAKDPTRTGRQKIRIEQLVGDDVSRGTGVWVKKVRIIDRENDRYLEEVINPDTGEVIHRCEEPLSDHFGHGSAKPPADDDPT